MKKITVIIPVLNAFETISKTIESLENQDFDKEEYEVIIVDDGSTDGTKSIVDNFIEKKKINLRYFWQKNIGSGLARNLGMENAQGEIIAFTDADCIPDRNWLSVIYKKIVEEKEVVICGETYTDEVVLFPWKMSPAGQKGIGANIAINFKVLNDIRFSDKFLGFLGQDKDFLFRIGEKGYPFKHVQEMKIMHPVNIRNLKKVVSRCRSRKNEVILHKLYREKVYNSFNFIFRPLLFGRISPITSILVLFWPFFIALIFKGIIYETAMAVLMFVFLFLAFFYKFLIINNPKKIPVPVNDRIKTFLFLIIYVHLFIYYRLLGSIKFRYLLL